MVLGLWPVILALFLCASGCGTSDREQVLHAVMTDNVQLLKQMDAKGVDLNAQFPERFNWTPLITAIYFQNTNAIAYLISRGVDVSKRDGTGNTALMEAITWDDTNTATLLFRKSPQAIRDGEDWPLVRNLIQAPPTDQATQNRWNALVDEFLRTNAVAKVKP
jgi:ankyrin repeat protein